MAEFKKQHYQVKYHHKTSVKVLSWNLMILLSLKYISSSLVVMTLEGLNSQWVLICVKWSFLIWFCVVIGASKLLDQITENEQERLYELERKDQENIQMQRQVEKMMNEDRVSLDKKKQEQECLRVRRVTKTIHKKTAHANHLN